MFCPQCGSENPNQARFCLICGAPFPQGEFEPDPEESGLLPEEPELLPEEPHRPIWPWVTLAAVALAAIGFLLFLLLTGGNAQPAAAAPAVTGAVVTPGGVITPEPSAQPAADGGVVSPSPTTEIVVITPSPMVVPVSPTPEVPEAVKVFYYTTPLDEFTEAKGNTLMLSAEAYPVDHFTNASFQWTVSDPSVVKLEPAAFGRTCDITILKVASGPVTLTVSCCGAHKDVKIYTKEAAVPSAKPGPVTLDKDTQYRINIFLSNFSEQRVLPFHSATVADDYLLRVVELYCKINHPGLISYLGGDECLSLKDANTYMERFFGRTVNPYEGATYLLDASNTFSYSGGYFRFPASDGEAYNRFTVVDEMTANGDGTYTVSFQVYEISLEQYWNTPGVDNSLYWLNHDQVADKVWKYEALPVQGGTAVVRDYNFGGKPTYQIITYDVWDISFSY